MKKLLVIAAVSMLAACKSLFICEVEEAKFSGNEAQTMRQEKIVWTAQDGMFALNSYELTPTSKKSLDEIAAKLKRNPSVNVEITGHTDNTGSRAYNMQLSHKRANAAAEYLKSRGISENRITASGYGPDRPAASNDTAEGRAQNRRIEIIYR